MFVIGKSSQLCFKNIKSFPGRTETNKSGMTGTFLEEWVKDLNRGLQVKDRKIALLVFNSSTVQDTLGCYYWKN